MDRGPTEFRKTNFGGDTSDDDKQQINIASCLRPSLASCYTLLSDFNIKLQS